MDFSKVSDKDLIEFLSWDYGITIDPDLPLEIQAEQLFNQLEHGEILPYPPYLPYPIVDLYLASMYTGPKNMYTYDQVMNLSSEDMDHFISIFNLDPEDGTSNRDRIFRILTYLDLIDIREELVQPHILDYLCQNLSLDDLNNYRRANWLDRIECQITVKDRSDYQYRTFPELTDQTYQWTKIIENHGSRHLFMKLVSQPDKFISLVNYGFTPGTDIINAAAKNGSLDLVKYILENELSTGIDMGLKIAGYNGKWDIVTYLVDFGGDPTIPFLSAVRYNDFNMVDYLLDEGADMNYSWKEDPGLLLASTMGNLDMVKHLIDRGADINTTGLYRTNALIPAIIGNHFDIIKYLVEHGIDVNPELEFITIKDGYAFTSSLDILDNAFHQHNSKYDEEKYHQVRNYLIENGAKYGYEL